MNDDQRSEEEKRDASLQLLEANHQFPGPFMFKVIGSQTDDFVERVLETFRNLRPHADDLPFRTRETASGRHIAVTVEPTVRTAEEVLVIYAEIKQIDGVVMIL